MTPSQIAKQVQNAAKEAARKLAKGKSGCMGFLRQKKDNTTTLNIIVPNDGVIPGTNERPVLLGSLIGKLQHGTGQLQGFKEDRRNLVKAGKEKIMIIIIIKVIILKVFLHSKIY